MKLAALFAILMAASVAQAGDDSAESVIIQLRMGGPLPRVTFRWMGLGKDLAALQRVVYREKAPAIKVASSIAEQMAAQFPYQGNAMGIRSELAAQRAWLLKLLDPLFRSLRSTYFDEIALPALNASATEWSTQVSTASAMSPWHSTARLTLAAATLQGLLQLSLRDDAAESLRKLNACIGRALAKGATDRDELRSIVAAAEPRLNDLMLSPRARPLASLLQVVLQEEIRP